MTGIPRTLSPIVWIKSIVGIPPGQHPRLTSLRIDSDGIPQGQHPRLSGLSINGIPPCQHPR